MRWGGLPAAKRRITKVSRVVTRWYEDASRAILKPTKELSL